MRRRPRATSFFLGQMISRKAWRRLAPEIFVLFAMGPGYGEGGREVPTGIVHGRSYVYVIFKEVYVQS